MYNMKLITCNQVVNKLKRIFVICSLLVLTILMAPVPSSAQTPSLPDVNVSINNLTLPGPISDFIDKLKGINVGPSTPGGSGSIDLSSLRGFWDSLNNWFSSNIGISFTDIIKLIFNFIIWVWELVIKLIQAGLSYL